MKGSFSEQTFGFSEKVAIEKCNFSIGSFKDCVFESRTSDSIRSCSFSVVGFPLLISSVSIFESLDSKLKGSFSITLLSDKIFNWDIIENSLSILLFIILLYINLFLSIILIKPKNLDLIKIIKTQI